MTRKSFILLLFALFIILQGKAQNGNVHYCGGVSHDSIHSSNIGSSCEATGLNSFAGGDQSLAQGASSFAFGSMARATQPGSFALGGMAWATASTSLSLGFYVNATQNSSIVIGSGVGSWSPLVASVSGITMGMGSTHPTLYISRAATGSMTGKVAIGDVLPQAKLHIQSDPGEDASLILAPAEPSNNGTYLQLRDGAHRIAVGNDGVMLFTAGNSNRMDVASSNLNVGGSTAVLGTLQQSRLYLSSDAIPCLSSNAMPTSGGYARNAIAPSYVLEFGHNGFLLRTANYIEPRYDFITNWRDALSVKTNGAITLNGMVGINTENTTGNYALAVDGGLITTKVHIQEVSLWQDAVFGEDYPLMPLDEVEAYVAANGHLPGIPSEAEVRAEGFDLAEMQAVLLGKIEELTLHAIRQQREIDSLRQLVTVRFSYDACGNRTGRTVEFSRTEDDRGNDPSGEAPNNRWQASLTDNFVGADMMLFPNPTEGGFFLSLSGEALPENAVATLCAVNGTVLEERSSVGALEEFDLDGKPAGVYLLRLSCGDAIRTWRIVKHN